jgi:hypothetical protein
MRPIDLKFQALAAENNMDPISAVTAAARLISTMKPIDVEEFKIITDQYIDIRIERGEFEKALYYAYTVLVDCLKDSENQEKQQRKNKILDYIALCVEKMRS